MKKCIGCGIALQTNDANQPGYTPKNDALYCQRCYQLTHYGKLAYSAKEEISADKVLSQVAEMNALVLWIVDLFDLESAWKENFARYLSQHDILMVCTKRDLLPDSVGQEKLSKYLLARLKENQINVKGIVVIGEHGTDGKEELRYAVETLRNNRDVVLIGTTNAGKSTVLRTVFDQHALTVSRYPGTTLDFIALKQEDYTLYDTPGFNRKHSVQILAEDADMDRIIPYKRIKPRVYQLNSEQSLAIGGIMRIDLYGVKQLSVTAYFADTLAVHRGKITDADRLWATHKGGLLSPVVKGDYFTKKQTFLPKYDKNDIVIVGLGWLCFSGELDKIVVSGSDETEVLLRKAMI